jgi:hypothetical protein
MVLISQNVYQIIGFLGQGIQFYHQKYSYYYRIQDGRHDQRYTLEQLCIVN